MISILTKGTPQSSPPTPHPPPVRTQNTGEQALQTLKPTGHPTPAAAVPGPGTRRERCWGVGTGVGRRWGAHGVLLHIWGQEETRLHSASDRRQATCSLWRALRCFYT